jgi:hypothetical protein
MWEKEMAEILESLRKEANLLIVSRDTDEAIKDVEEVRTDVDETRVEISEEC